MWAPSRTQKSLNQPNGFYTMHAYISVYLKVVDGSPGSSDSGVDTRDTETLYKVNYFSLCFCKVVKFGNTIYFMVNFIF